MFRRNESCFEIKQKAMKEQIRHDLELFLADNCQAWVLHGDGSYERVARGKNKAVSAQSCFLETLSASGQKQGTASDREGRSATTGR